MIYNSAILSSNLQRTHDYPEVNMKRTFSNLYILLLKVAIIISIISSLSACSKDPNKIMKYHLERGEKYLQGSQYREAAIEFKNVIQIDEKNVKGHYNLGLAYLKLGDIPNLQLAFRELSRAVELDPNLMEAHLKMGELYLFSKDFDKALEKAELVLSKEADNIDANILLATGHAGKSEFKKAIKIMEDVIKINPRSIRPYMAAAGIYIAKKDMLSAEKTYKMAISIKNDAIEPRLALANLYLRQGKIKEAEAGLKEALQVDPKNWKALFALASLYASTKRFKDAEKLYEEIIAAKPEDPAGYIYLADSYIGTSKKETAKEVLKRGLEKNPLDQNQTLKKRLSELLLDLKEYKEASTYINAILDKDLKDSHALFLRGRLRLAENKVNEAIEDLKLSTEREPNFPLSHYYLGIAYQASGNIQTAKSELSDALKLAPDLDGARLALATLHFGYRDYKLALQEAQRVLERHPEDSNANLIVGDVRLRQLKPDEAKPYFEKVIKNAPKDPRGYARLGLVYQAKKNNKAAIEQFEKSLSIESSLDVLSMITAIHLANNEPQKAIERVMTQMKQSPQNPFLHHLIARVYIVAGDLKRAEESLKKAIELKNDLVAAYIDLGNIYVQRGALDEAIKQYKDTIKINPKVIQPYMLLGVIYERQGKINDAIENYKKALEINPKFAPAANNLAWLYAEHGGNIDVALGLAEKAKEAMPDDPAVSDTLGWIYYKKQVYLTAISHLKESSEKMPDNPVVRYHLGMAYYKKGDKELAKKELLASLKIDDKYAGSEEAKKTLKELK